VKTISAYGRVTPRFVLTVNLDTELDRATGVRYIRTVHENSVMALLNTLLRPPRLPD